MEKDWVTTELRGDGDETRWQESKLEYTNRLYAFNFAMERLAALVEK